MQQVQPVLLKGLKAKGIIDQQNCMQEAFRKAAVAALTKRLQGSVATATTAAGSELDSLFSVQAKLTQ